MPGPAPKHRSLRARRNKASTRAKLRPKGSKKALRKRRTPTRAPAVRAPALPSRACPCGGPVEPPKPRKKRGRGRPRKPPPPCVMCEGTGILPWHHLTQVWWRRLWASPMSPEYAESDLDGLYVLAALRDEHWRTGGVDTKLAGEIRLWEARFGLSPIDRRRLEWKIPSPEESEAVDAPAPPTRPDPRIVPEISGGRPN